MIHNLIKFILSLPILFFIFIYLEFLCMDFFINRCHRIYNYDCSVIHKKSDKQFYCENEEKKGTACCSALYVYCEEKLGKDFLEKAHLQQEIE